MRLACDLEDYLLNGSAGLGFVYVGDTTAYHTARDNVTMIDRGSLQQEGDNTLAVVRAFGNDDLANLPREANRVFFTVLPGVVLHYSGDWVIPLAVVVTVDGQALDLTGYDPADGELPLSYVAPTADGVTLTLAVRSTDAIAIDVRETSYGLPDVPGMTITDRPADMMPATGLPLDATVIRKSFSV